MNSQYGLGATGRTPFRPLSTTVIGWIWILIAVAKIVSSVQSHLKLRRLQAARAQSDESENVEAMLDAIEWLIGGSYTELAVSMVMACVIIPSAIALLRLRSWGRITVICLTWFTFISGLVGIVFIAWLANSLRLEAGIPLNAAAVTFAVFLLLQLLGGVALFRYVLRCLNSEQLLEAIELTELNLRSRSAVVPE